MSAKHKILFTCQHNRGRNQIAQAYLKRFAGEGFAVAGKSEMHSINGCQIPKEGTFSFKALSRP